MKIAYTKPSIGPLEIEYANDAVASGWGEKCYNYIVRFEKEFAEHLGVKFAIATSSCTGAMTLGLDALRLQSGDEVILADTNWIATASPIVHLGAVPVFIDICEDSWCIDHTKLEAAITPKTKAIVATHLYGNLCDMDAINEIAVKYNIPVIEDAAEAIGSVYKGKRAGSMGLFSTFSFHGTKTLTTGEGGMFVTNDCELYERVLTLNNHGRLRAQNKQFWADITGYKYKMSNVQAAIGCAQLSRVDELVARKREILQAYRSAFEAYPQIEINSELQNTVSGCWMPNIVFDHSSSVTREHLIAEFRKSKIDARVFFWPLSSLPMFMENVANKHAYDIPKRSINLPSFHEITDEQIAAISNLAIQQLK